MRCNRRDGCPHEAVAGLEQCIFHLPVERKAADDFWRHFANWYIVLLNSYDMQLRERLERDLSSWVWGQRDSGLVSRYSALLSSGQPSGFAGFVFPEAGGGHHFTNLPFPAAVFRSSVFTGGAVFQGARFLQPALFVGAVFKGGVSFLHASFEDEANFLYATFDSDVHFGDAQFARRANFTRAFFGREADFGGVRFSGPVYFVGSTVQGHMKMTGAILQDRLLFMGTKFLDASLIQLWGLDFVRGVADIHLDPVRTSGTMLYPRDGRLVESAGRVVFRDIAKNMSRVSFLHTDLFSDRLNVRFAAVKWDKDPQRFLFDHTFSTGSPEDWHQRDARIDTDEMLGLFNVEAPSQPGETSEQAAARRAVLDSTISRIVPVDVERIAREIRRFYEEYGSYVDAGDYYTVEMDYRRWGTPWLRNFFTRLALEIYRRVSKYGESPIRALACLAAIIAVFASIYVFTGFKFQGNDVQRLTRIDPRHTLATLGDFGRSCLFALANLVPGYFRLQSDRLASTSEATTILSFFEAIFGVTTLTMFVLAVRRRFSR